ncbi:MAG: EAL domain-containing protein [Aquabacterium sp.]|uniref:EAL domain-containing protein n=1 Tax=Aquabacterium sp. TaxID=1872578 RepID=UPI0025C0B351|nr:EAL domain-containing protein [Aquabacterium sp.]MBI5927620.1 EAL domain-containing protein [Aquabacterium sp.]
MKSLLKSLLLLSILLLAVPVQAGRIAFDIAQAPGRGEWLDMATLVATDPPTEAGPDHPPADHLAWRAQRHGVRTIGFEHKGVWARTVLKNSSESPILGWVVVTEPYTDYVDCFIDSEGSESIVYRQGDHRPFDSRPIKYPGVILPVNIYPRSSLTLTCLMRNNGSTAATFQYWTPENYAVLERETAFSRALCYGALGFTLLVSIVLAFINGNPLSFLMVAEILPVLAATASREGDAYQMLWPTHPEFNIPPYMWILIGISTATLVFRWIIQPSQWEDRIIKALALSSTLILSFAIAMPALAPQISALVQGISVIYPIALIWICARHWHEGAVARLLCFGMVVQMAALVINAVGVLGIYHGQFGVASMYACVIKALTLAAALFYRMKMDRQDRARAQAEHTMELERRLAYEAQLRDVVSHHPRYGMPNQAMLEESIRAQLAQVERGLSIWIVKLNRFGFLESILPPDTLTAVVRIYGDELKSWFASMDADALLTIEGEHRLAALDDSTLAFVTVGKPSDALMSDLESFLVRRFEWQGLFVAWDPHVGVAQVTRAHLEQTAGMSDEARIALQWCSAHRRVVPFDAERMKREQLAYGLTLDLEGAIDRGELLLHYQPKVTLETRRTDSLEALVRWRHPERGMIPPGAFIAEAEATGAINRLTMWAIAEAAHFLLTLPDPHVRVSVNITAFDLATPRFVDKVLETLRHVGCPPCRLILEVTESAALSDRERATQILSRLREEGVKIALDDFGTGYSSLGILQEMPLDEMKVDRSFVTDIAEFGRKQAVLQAMIEVGHRLGLTVTIEGVEHGASVDWLADHGCDVVQGYFFSRPLDADAARTWLTRPIESVATA